MIKSIFNPLTGEFDYVLETDGDYVVNYAGDYVVQNIVENPGITVNYRDNASTPSIALTMLPNNRYLFSSPVNLLTLTIQEPTEPGSYIYELDFVSGDSVSVKISDSVSWVKTPAFIPGKRYLISIEISVVENEKRTIGMYLEMEA
ncbi:MAG: hypothetical protein IKY27_08565 [Bacteroidales bacterium]|nr:hypothetical protein [Bacteroidales bacterium]MBR5782013.1 hypothetical protein [Bacteroidales bacterium]